MQSYDRTGMTEQDGKDHRFVEGLADTVVQDIVLRKPGVAWRDIASLEEAKRVLKEAVVLPMLMPEMFQGIREPWRGILLFGSPGYHTTLIL